MQLRRFQEEEAPCSSRRVLGCSSHCRATTITTPCSHGFLIARPAQRRARRCVAPRGVARHHAPSSEAVLGSSGRGVTANAALLSCVRSRFRDAASDCRKLCTRRPLEYVLAKASPRSGMFVDFSNYRCHECANQVRHNGAPPNSRQHESRERG